MGKVDVSVIWFRYWSKKVTLKISGLSTVVTGTGFDTWVDGRCKGAGVQFNCPFFESVSLGVVIVKVYSPEVSTRN